MAAILKLGPLKSGFHLWPNGESEKKEKKIDPHYFSILEGVYFLNRTFLTKMIATIEFLVKFWVKWV